MSDEELVGKVLLDKGFMSTSTVKGSEFGGSVKLEIYVPAGVKQVNDRECNQKFKIKKLDKVIDTDKLFKEMVTTKGKNGTGLGLFMSYSNIRAHFNGNITVNSETGVGTEFRIILPV